MQNCNGSTIGSSNHLGGVCKHRPIILYTMKPAVAADEMFPEGVGPYMDVDEVGGPSAILVELTSNEKVVHANFIKDFGDLFDDEDLS